MSTNPLPTDDWQPCPQGELERMVHGLNARKRTRQWVRGGGSLAIVALAAIVVYATIGTSGKRSPHLHGGIECAGAAQHFQAFHDGTLPAELAAKVAAHIKTCPDCGLKYKQFLARLGEIAFSAGRELGDAVARLGHRPVWSVSKPVGAGQAPRISSFANAA